MSTSCISYRHFVSFGLTVFDLRLGGLRFLRVSLCDTLLWRALLDMAVVPRYNQIYSLVQDTNDLKGGEYRNGVLIYKQ